MFLKQDLFIIIILDTCMCMCDYNNIIAYSPLFFVGIGFSQNQFTVLEGENVNISIAIETSDDLPLDPAIDVTLLISNNVEEGNTAIDLNRLMGDISFNAQSDRIVTFTVPQGQRSKSTLSFKGITIMDNEILDMELHFVLLIDGFSLSQTTGQGIFGFTLVVVEDDDDGKSMSRILCL